MLSVRATLGWLIGLAMFCGSAVALATGHAAELLKSINELRTNLYSQAQEKTKDGKIDVLAIQEQIRGRAEEAVKSVDPVKVDPAEALDWAQLFNLAGRPKDTATLLVNFIGTNPEPPKLYQAQTMLLGASWMTHDDKSVAADLQSMKPYDGGSSVDYAATVATYAPHVMSQLGPDEAVALIDKALAGVTQPSLTDAQRKHFASVETAALFAKIDIYRESGQKDKALALIDDKIKTETGALKSRLTTTRNQIGLVGTAAPELKIERGYGKFAGLDSVKGKVVVLDFFAHWCGPCKAAFPEMRQLYADLQAKGLEVVGVTRYYGYIGDPDKKLAPDEEYAKMAAFMKEEKMTWPVVFGPAENFQAYGVTAIPHVVVVGRDGTVHSLDVGYSQRSFAELRKKVEALLGEK